MDLLLVLLRPHAVFAPEGDLGGGLLQVVLEHGARVEGWTV